MRGHYHDGRGRGISTGRRRIFEEGREEKGREEKDREEEDREVVGEAGIEPATPSLEGSCSIRLSYSPLSFAYLT